MHNHELEELFNHRSPEQPWSHAEHPRSYAVTAATAPPSNFARTV
jgi:hypothetical protein